jgi:DNA-binding MarR family transcriptional regulator
MREGEEGLVELFEYLLRRKIERSSKIFSECGVSDITIRQISYLKTIDEQGNITFSRLAEITRNSKPTITEVIRKFERMECVLREPCPEDKRVLYIRLTEKGRRIARAEHTSLRQVIEELMDSLDEPDQERLIRLLKKSGNFFGREIR